MELEHKEKLINDFTLLIQEVIKTGITDLHISSGEVPFARLPSRDVEPVPHFGTLEYTDVVAIIQHMENSITEEVIANRKEGINFVYEFE